MGDLSKNFSRHEFACEDNCGFDSISPELVETLQVIRAAAGRSVVITSGCRCAAQNALDGGVANSSHRTGKAADFYVPGWKNKQLGDLVQKLDGEGKIPHMCYTYKIVGRKKTNTAVHLDVDKTKNRRSKYGPGY